MVKVFYSDEVRKLEELTLQEKSMVETELMYQAGYVLTKDFLSRMMPSIDEEILVVAGVGKNGGDALVMFRELERLGYNISLFVLGDKDKSNACFKHYYNQLDESHKEIHSEDLKKKLKSTKFVIDGIFGMGLKRNIENELYEIIELINNQKLKVYSIDFPSGINPDSGKVMGCAVRAKFTGVVGAYKLGNFLNDALDYHGEIKLLDIGLLEGYSDIYFLDYNDLDVSRIRIHNSYKYTYGNNAFVGSSKLPGAINLAAIAAMKSGLGLAEVFYDQEASRYFIELIYKNISELEDLDKYDVFCFGPGITDFKDVYQNILSKVVKLKKKIVCDAGGLKYLDLKKTYDNLIITPHAKELSKLVDLDVIEVTDNPVKYLRILAKKGIITLLKGTTSIVQEQRYTYLMQAKNNGLATAGTGDVLAGIISAFLVEESTVNACCKGLAVFMKAADFARKRRGEVSMVASDVVDNLYKVWSR
ncbi:MAG: NAD(P)H-hydrate dehydratase [Candidatus Izemoplasmatales bacterium]|jgi:NAD(P)H-hydrate epimerase|nr:NAD(P)H-hydrate dehydratase [Candidatus Izemoplasmatales bacterium]